MIWKRGTPTDRTSPWDKYWVWRMLHILTIISAALGLPLLVVVLSVAWLKIHGVGQ
jgi:hypothetical protein